MLSVAHRATVEGYVRGVCQGCQVLLNFSILLLKLRFCYWNFHEILAKILKFVLISELLPHKNTEICTKLCKNTEIIAICYWSEFPEVGSPGYVNGMSKNLGNFFIYFTNWWALMHDEHISGCEGEQKCWAIVQGFTYPFAQWPGGK